MVQRGPEEGSGRHARIWVAAVHRACGRNTACGVEEQREVSVTRGSARREQEGPDGWGRDTCRTVWRTGTGGVWVLPALAFLIASCVDLVVMGRAPAGEGGILPLLKVEAYF